MKYAQFDANGNISGFFDDSINSKEQIGDAIEITEEQWIDCINNPGKWLIVNRALELAPPIPDSVLIEQAKSAQISTLASAYNAAIQQPVSYMGTTFQADSDSQTKVIQVLAAMTPAGATPAGFYWVDAANDHVAMTLAQVQGLSQAMMAQGWAAFQHLQTRKTSVNAAATIPDVQAITF
jgi:hypothetical protein